MATIEQLLEQTSFLLDKQKEAKEDCLKIFGDLITAVEKKLTLVQSDAEELESLEQVHDLITGHAQKLADDADEDIEVLDEQLKTLQQIKGIKDPARIKEMLDMIMPEDEELMDTESFKKEVTQESGLAKQNLLIAAHDIKEAIKEGSSKDLRIMLEAMLEDEEEGDEDEEEGESIDLNFGGGCGDCKGSCGSEDEKAGEEKSGGCGTGGGCGKGCSSEEGEDLFDQLSRYAEEQNRRKGN